MQEGQGVHKSLTEKTMTGNEQHKYACAKN